jgi:hypothetical protein
MKEIFITPRRVKYLIHLGKFEGYSQFPRPLSQPFFNCKIPSKEKNKLSNIIKNDRFFTSKNKHLLTIKTNEGLHYLTSSISLNDEETKKKLINSINQFMEEFREEHKFKADMIDKEPKVIALNRFKKLLLENNGDKKIFGKTLKEPLSKYNEINMINKTITQNLRVNADKNSESEIKKSNNSNFKYSNDKNNLSFCNFKINTSVR